MHKLNFIIYYNVVMGKIKDEKGEFWYDFAIVRKLMSTHCIKPSYTIIIYKFVNAINASNKAILKMNAVIKKMWVVCKHA